MITGLVVLSILINKCRPVDVVHYKIKIAIVIQVGIGSAIADVNADDLEDVYVGGGSGNSAAIFLQAKNGLFTKKSQPAFEVDKQSTDADAIFLCNTCKHCQESSD